MRTVFSDIYFTRAWGNQEESVSGPGSGVVRTSAIRKEVSSLLTQMRTKVLLDAGCGDFNWMKDTELCADRYAGVDVVPEIVLENRRKHKRAGRDFITLDITEDELPQVDMILCTDCLVDFSFADALKAIRNFKKSESRYILTTTFVMWPQNTEIVTGGWRQLNLQMAPFNFPPPMKVIDEKCDHTGGTYAGKRLALWDLRSISI